MAKKTSKQPTTKKTKQTPKPTQDATPEVKIRLLESDSPDGPWTEFDPKVPGTADRITQNPDCIPGELQVIDMDLARMDDPVLEERHPIDHRSTLGMVGGVQEGLGFARVDAIHARFGRGCTKADIKDYVERMGRRWEGISWTDVCTIMQRENSEMPPDLMTLTVAVTRYIVSRSTLRRAIKDAKIRSFQIHPGDETLYVSESDLKREWPQKTK